MTARSTRTAPEAGAAPSGATRQRIAVVEDDEDLAFTLTYNLKKDGRYEVERYAGGLVAMLDGFVDPRTGYVVSYKALAIIVLGGLGSVRGTLVASLVLGVVESYGTIFIGSWLNRDAIAFLALIALLMIRPQGFTGAKTA